VQDSNAGELRAHPHSLPTERRSVIDFLVAEEIIISIIERSIILNSLVDWGSFFLVQDD
jgi:hypothetical protein